MANPFLVIGGVIVSIIAASIGVLQVPGWVASAQDSAAQNDLAQLTIGEAAAISTTGSAVDSIEAMNAPGIGVKVTPSNGVVYGIDANGRDYVVATVSASGTVFVRVNGGEVLSFPNVDAARSNTALASQLSGLGLEFPLMSADDTRARDLAQALVSGQNANYPFLTVQEAAASGVSVPEVGDSKVAITFNYAGSNYSPDSGWVVFVESPSGATWTNAVLNRWDDGTSEVLRFDTLAEAQQHWQSAFESGVAGAFVAPTPLPVGSLTLEPGSDAYNMAQAHHTFLDFEGNRYGLSTEGVPESEALTYLEERSGERYGGAVNPDLVTVIYTGEQGTWPYSETLTQGVVLLVEAPDGTVYSTRDQWDNTTVVFGSMSEALAYWGR